MTVNKDLVTTIAGAVGAASLAVQPVTQVVAESNLDTNGILKLVLAITFAVIGFFTGRPQAS